MPIPTQELLDDVLRQLLESDEWAHNPTAVAHAKEIMSIMADPTWSSVLANAFNPQRKEDEAEAEREAEELRKNPNFGVF